MKFELLHVQVLSIIHQRNGRKGGGENLYDHFHESFENYERNGYGRDLELLIVSRYIASFPHPRQWNYMT